VFEAPTLNRLPSVDDPFSAANDSPANLLGLIWFVVVAAMVYFGVYMADRRAFKENPDQFRGWNNKDR